MTAKRKVNFVVTDLDDTIWDWLKMWHNSFEPYLQRISSEFNIDIEVLKNDFKKIHQKYGSSEFSFVFKELETLTEEQKGIFDVATINQKSILHEYNSLKKYNLSLYDGVIETLKEIKQSGALIVGFTESNAFFTKYRIKHLEIDGLLDCIYAPVDMGVPESVYKHYSEDYWQPQITEMRYLSKSILKPAPEILEIILKDFNADKDTTIYIGDKLDKDISMANTASVTSVYAKYGHRIETEQYELLRDVTHWTESDVQREKEYKLKETQNPIANFTLEKSFKELKNYFSFFPYDYIINPQNAPHVIKIWEKVIDVQQHFNDIELRIRNIAITTFTFIIGGIGFLEIGGLEFEMKNSTVPYSTILAVFGFLIICAFFYMDRWWYHKLLSGAVKKGLQIEEKWSKFLPEITLSESIANSSPHRFIFPKLKVHSKDKFWIFYGLLLIPLAVLGLVLFFIGNNC
jgi:phosphoglycolate phosphatase-like HAD superfamily hydrolase